MNKLRFIFSLLSNIGFIVLIPVLLHAFGISAPIEFLESRLGIIAGVSSLTLIGFLLIAFQVFFGGGDHIRATVLGFFVGFLLVATAVEMGFMLWFKNWVAESGYFDNLPLNYLAGVLVAFVGIRMSYSRKPNFLKEVFVLLLVPIGLLYGAQAAGIQNFNPDFSISLNSGIASLRQFVDENYLKRPEIQDYIEEVDNNEDLNEEEKIEKIKELQKKIDKLEKDQAILKNLQGDKTLYEDNLGDIKNTNWCADAKTDEAKTKSYAEAVTPDKPCVRDFAVNLAKKAPGPYSRNKILPGEEGIKQICTIHLYLSTNWKYVSDPVALRDDYNSTASRSLAIGMAGDCDDYSILMSSSIQAIGGTSRIMYGTCSNGAHAWSEVLIGNREQWNQAVQIIRDYFNDNTKKVSATKDEHGQYWLPLDWILGEYTCNEGDLEVLYSSLDVEEVLIR